MALIERMSILGIRSFGQEVPQKIEFFTPVTLILGQNGTGKTTVIECLKYSATGELPPGSKTGCSFIHDPRIAQECEVKAKITLQIRDVKGCPMVVSRALMATQRDKAKQGTLKTLDGSIKRQHPDGRVTSASLRCADLDQEMVSSLGVSKAVLENVIFCHQEDSNWPLQEAKAVKQRFDDLFASSRYVKALDAIRKCKQDNDGNVKLYKTELKHLTKSRDEASKLRCEREETLHSIEEQEKHLEEMSAKLQPVVEQLNRYKRCYTELTHLQAEIKSCEIERAHLTDAIANLLMNVHDEFKGSDEELKYLVEDAETEYTKKILQLNQLEDMLQKKRKELNALETDRTKSIVERAQIEMEVKRLSEAITSRDMILISLVSHYIPEDRYKGVKQFNDADAQYITDHIEGLLHESENQLAEVKLISENEERKVQADVDMARDELAGVKQKIETTKRNFNQNNDELTVVKKRLENEHTLNKRLEEIKDEFHKAEIAVNDLDIDDELDSLHHFITESFAEKRRIESSISSLDDRIATYQNNVIKYRAFESMLKERANKLESIRKINHLQEKRDQLKVLEEKLLSVPGADELEQTVTNLQQRRALLEEECANEQGSVFLWRKFRDRLCRMDSDCPVCHRCFDSDTERNELLSEIDNRIQSVPTESQRKKQELKDIVSHLESLVELRPVSTEILNLKEKELPAVESKMKSGLDKLSSICGQRDKTAAVLETCQADEFLAKTMQGDLAILERLENESFELTLKINSFRTEFTDCVTNDSQSIEVLQEERKTLREKLRTSSDVIDQKQKRIDQLNQAKHQAISEMHRLKDEMHKLEQENLNNVRLRDELSRLTSDCETLKTELHELEANQLPNVHRHWAEACTERNRLIKKHEQTIEQATVKVNEVHERLKNLTEVCDSVRNASISQPTKRLKDIQETVGKLETKLCCVRSELDTCSENMEFLKKQINEHKVRQRELADCIQLRHLRCQLTSLTQRTESLIQNHKDCNNFPGSDQDLIKETKRLSLEEENLHSLKQDVSNQLSELKAKLHYLNRDLNEKYASADSEYRDMMYLLKTSELACTDLERYYKALDRAIMSYHAVKMADLNKIIRELWRSTYRGNDIDYIEICSEEDTSAASNVSRTRRTYNYRVVMVKTSASVCRSKSKDSSAYHGEARLDMRGRCSAGQKVLASLIIRLALAEVFCLHCGVLALDEPTTNLDRENIESLAYALVEIIKNRRRQKNFQLIVITHDADFVELLGRSDYVENFFLLSRDAQGLSEIKKVPIGEHFQ
uniref:DNA repair protein RAD50 n=1 Tax=Trichobilharzia regenti TaxID=157069 RepID=A0AA85IR63_TRIRE|nr:unnamed protein product [Trichobilharzia regenti]